MKLSKIFNNSFELAFRKAVEENTKKDKEAIKDALFQTKKVDKPIKVQNKEKV